MLLTIFYCDGIFGCWGGGGATAVEPERGGVPCPNVDRGEATVGGEETVEHGQGGGGGGETRR
jgi:hypothetical protein